MRSDRALHDKGETLTLQQSVENIGTLRPYAFGAAEKKTPSRVVAGAVRCTNENPTHITFPTWFLSPFPRSLAKIRVWVAAHISRTALVGLSSALLLVL